MCASYHDVECVVDNKALDGGIRHSQAVIVRIGYAQGTLAALMTDRDAR